MKLGLGLSLCRIGGAEALFSASATWTDTDQAGGSMVTTRTFTSMALGSAETGRRVVAVIGYDSAGSLNDITSVTIGGVSATLHIAQQDGSGRTVEIWSATSVSGTTGNVVVAVNGTGSYAMSVDIYKVMDSDGVYDTAGGTTSADTVSGAIDVEARGVIVAGAYFTASSLSSSDIVFTGVTQDNTDNANVGNVARRSAVGSYAASTLTTNRTVSAVCAGSSSYNSIIAAVSFSPR